MDRVTIIGGGQGGATTAQQLRSLAYPGEIVIVSASSHRPYERPPLSKGVLAPDLAPVPVVPDDLYEHNGVQLRLDEPAEHILPDLTVVTARGTIASTAVVLATGSRSKRLTCAGSDLPGVIALHDIEDAREISMRTRSDSRVVVVGGGLIGSEVAAVLVDRVQSVTVVDVVPHPMATKVGERVATRIEAAQYAAGIRFLQGGVKRIEGADGVNAVLCADGTRIPADLVITGLGARPCTDVAAASMIDVGDGVEVDGCGRTSRVGVHAVGDIARWPYGGLGVLRTEHYKGAIDQATVVASAILGREPARPLVPWFWTEQLAGRIEVVGAPRLADEVVVASTDETTYVEHCLRRGRLVGAVGVNAGRAIRAAGKKIAAEQMPDEMMLNANGHDVRRTR